jgi:sialic acid synthase SpsE
MRSTQVKIGSASIGNDHPVYFIADVGANHDGKIDRAYKLIELAKEAGADAAKFQNFQAAKIVSRKGFESLGGKQSHQSSWKKSVYEVYEDASVSYEWTAKLKEKCKEVGIEYFTSPYDFESVDHVDQYVEAYKIGSGDITWPGIIRYIASKKKPLILATGASTMDDVKRAVNIIHETHATFILMQCNTNYTASTENFKYINLNVLKTYAQLFPNVILGLSDHTLGHATVLGAVTLGARAVEKHFTDDNGREGPDHKFAMNPKTWREMVDRTRELDFALGDGIKRIEENEAATAFLQRRGLRYKTDQKQGHVLRDEDLFPLRPFSGEGIAPYDVKKATGKALKRDVKADEAVLWSDLT